MLADTQTNYGVFCVHAQWFSHWKIKADDCDIISWCHNDLMLFWEGTIKREHTQTSRLSTGVSATEWLGLLTSHRPSTPAILVPLMEQSITRINCVFHLSICIYPDLLGKFSVSMTLVVWSLLGRSLPASPWTWYWAKQWSQPFGSRLWGQDKLLIWCESLPIYQVYLCTTCHISNGFEVSHTCIAVLEWYWHLEWYQQFAESHTCKVLPKVYSTAYAICYGFFISKIEEYSVSFSCNRLFLFQNIKFNKIITHVTR